ncbi:LysR substrate-binding domain-containing protein [Ramlibacter sp. AN1015]|uniref:LysR family transcriptional regulator n=1 Tax=Ramlibacter sp. AN1015 TaxID=3133428 RepID=UPI0030BF2C03
MRTLSLDELEIFRCVAREGGVLRAASRLHRVPSNVTTRIKQLEARLEVPLFRRQGRGLVLTDAGQTLLGYADRLLRLADEAEQDMRSGTVRGTLRLGSLESAAATRLPPLLSQFHQQHPDVSVELRTGTTAASLRLLERFELEAAFVSEPFEAAGMNAVPVFDEELVLITARHAPPPRGAAQLDGCTMVAFPHGCSYRRRLLEWLAQAGAAPARLLDLGSYHAIVACVAAGSGVGIVPAEVLDHTVLADAVQRHRLPARLRVNRTHLVWSGEPSVPLRALMELLPARSRGGRRRGVASPGELRLAMTRSG